MKYISHANKKEVFYSKELHSFEAGTAFLDFSSQEVILMKTDEHNFINLNTGEMLEKDEIEDICDEWIKLADEHIVEF